MAPWSNVRTSALLDDAAVKTAKNEQTWTELTYEKQNEISKEFYKRLSQNKDRTLKRIRKFADFRLVRSYKNFMLF